MSDALDPHAPTLVADSDVATQVPEASAETRSLLPGPELLAGRYEILGLLGAGGMGSVYRARDRELDEEVALKMLRRELMSVPGILDRFRREVKLARKVTHPNVARTFDIGEHGGERFLTMELVDGESLSGALEREGALSLARAVPIAIAICSGLAAAHAAGVVHRDLKPDNVLLGRDGSIKITDFGIAKVDADARLTQGPVGTPAYMAPEQVMAAESIDARADIYALGAMLYEMLTGALPFEGGSAYAIAAARLTTAPPDPRKRRPDLPGPLADLVLACLCRDPAGRPQRAEHVRDEMAKITLVDERPSIAMRVLAAPEVGVKTIAVLPLKNLGPAEDAYLADGLTDDLIDRLSMARDLRVRSRAAVQAIAHAGGDPRELGRELGVQVFVEGSVRRAADSVRIAARLVSVADGFQLWAQRFDGESREVLKLGDRAADAIAHALTVDREQQARPTIVDPEALDLYLRGRQMYHGFSGVNAMNAVELFRAASAKAPDEPTIMAAYALATVRAFALVIDDVDRLTEDPVAIAARAVALAPSSSDAHLAQATILIHSGDMIHSGPALRRALELSPSNAEANALAGRVLCEAGALHAGIRRLQIAQAIDPRLEVARVDEARAHVFLGDWDTSHTIMERSIPKDTEAKYIYWFARARMAIWLRSPQHTARLLEGVKGSDVVAEPRVAAALRFLVNGDLDVPQLELMVKMTDGRKLAARRSVYFEQLATEALTLAGRHEEAMHFVARADAHGLIDVAWLDFCPALDQLRQRNLLAEVRKNAVLRVEPILKALGESPRS